MTSPLMGLSGSTDRNIDATKDRTQLGRDQFLELLVAQLKHQDPLNPMQPDAFAAQLAQFSSVEQLTKLNNAFADQQAESVARTLLDKTTLGSSLIGKHIVAEGNQLVIGKNGATSFQLDVGGAGGKAILKLYDTTGKSIGVRSLGTVQGGIQTIRPPSDLPPGVYKYSVEVESSQGDPVAVRTFTDGVVDGVLFEGGQVLLRIGTIKVPIDKLSEITPTDN